MKGNVAKDDRLLLSPGSAAELLDCSRSTIYGAMKRGEIRYVRIGADRRIPVEEVRRIAAEGIKPRVVA
jgi:excisionase family DNA binding protein